MSKNMIRRQILAEISKISPKFLNDSSSTMTDIVLNISAIKACNSIFIYQSFQNEVQTDAIIKGLLSMGKTLAVPKLIQGEMHSVRYSTQQSINCYGINEPLTSEDIECEVAIIPALAFDKNLNRLGRGKGYYDKFLSNREIYKIGLAFSFQVLIEIPSTPLDIRMDMIVTEKGILT